MQVLLSLLCAEYKAHLVKTHVLFDSPDLPMIVHGLGRDWPDARGFFFNSNKSLIAWVNEEDHLKLISFAPGADFQALTGALVLVLECCLAFVHQGTSSQ
jgi:hypothetical protein